MEEVKLFVDESNGMLFIKAPDGERYPIHTQDCWAYIDYENEPKLSPEDRWD